MAFFISKLPFLLLLLLLLLVINVSLLANSEADDTTTFYYHSFDPKPDDLIYSGDAHAGPGNPFLRLTENVPNSRGQVLYSKPVKFWEAVPLIRKPNFEFVVFFNIRPPPPFADPFPYSFSFRMDPIDNSATHVFPLSVINVNSSSSSVFVNNDPSNRYIQFRISPRGFKSSTTGLLYATLKYEGEATRLSTTLSNGVETLTDSLIIDLTLFLTQQVRVGIQAFNVQSVAVHDLLSWYFTSEPGGIKQYV